MERLAALRALIASDRRRMDVLRAVRDLGLPDCWVAAGFVRNCVWDHVHGHAASPLSEDIDVVWFDAAQCEAECDAALERALRCRDGSLDWSVKNQARMHVRNGDAPYASATDAMRHWPETATAVGVRLGQGDTIDVAAPFGLDDLFGLAVRPTRRFALEKRAVYLARIRAKDWLGRWPQLRIDMSG
ncbi:nucleotidyltransferase family protein [Massilia pinisoli]|uniref:Nucleotidyltransferase family protein n=1 Tax=Massilia pinisoli TaxID=1772194 RepID=A0ABT1ZRT7_9BURK|nr:nucleotidyltransferase family protein [Massilia pinisoli]